jgi:hypothetical protein
MAQPVATIVLDNEAVAALLDTRHPKHRTALTYLEGIAQRRIRDPQRRVLVPVAVRVEAGWDRTDPQAAGINRTSGARDVPLTGEAANAAQRLRAATGVSVVDSSVAEAASSAPKPVVILTSDVDDMRSLASHLEGDVRVIRI